MHVEVFFYASIVAAPNSLCGPSSYFLGQAQATVAWLRMCVGGRSKADLLLVIGTSLQVAPVSKVMGWLPQSMPQILINRDVVAPPRSTSDGFDVSLIGAVALFCC